MADPEGSVETPEAAGDDVQQEQVDDTEESSDSSEEKQPAEDSEEDLPEQYRGKTPREIAEMHQNLERKLGNYKEVEEKARAFDQLSRVRQQPPPLEQPDIGRFVDQQGNIDVLAYDSAMSAYNTQLLRQSQEAARTSAREEVDTERAERDFPYLKGDRDSADAVVSMYQSGRAGSIYEAAKRLDKIRKAEVGNATKQGAATKEKEIAQKMRSSTERASGKANTELTAESFAGLSLDEKRNIVNSFGK